MKNNNMSLDALKAHLFEAIEGVKNQNDPEASANEKLSIDQAKAISDLSGRVIEIYKTQVNALSALNKMESPKNMEYAMIDMGVIEEKK